MIIIYFGIVLFIGLYISRGKDKSAKQYFLAGKNLGWIAIGASLFATNISSEHLVGLAGSGSIHGLGVGYFEWIAVIILFLLGWIFAPIFIRADVYTVPQFFGKRYDDKSRIFLTIISIFTYLFTKIGVTIVAGGLVLKQVLGWDMFTSAILIVLLTGLYTIIGGLYSVVYTQLFQTVVIIVGALFLSIFGFIEIGGFSGLVENLPADYFQMMKSFSDPDLPWTGILFGAPILGIWYWCSDQYIMQRILSAKGIKDARKGTFLAAVLKAFPILFLIFPGLVAAILYPEMKGDSAYSLLLSGSLLPIGIKGIVIAGFFAALMSSLASSFNSTASLVALDIYGFIKPTATENETVLVGRLSTMLAVIITIALIPILKFVDTHIYIDLQTLQAYVAPPIVSVFLVGVLWKNASSGGAIIALIMGSFISLIKFSLKSFDFLSLNDITIFREFNELNYLHFTIFLFIASTVVLIVASLIFPPKKYKESENSTELIERNKIDIYPSYNSIQQTGVNINKSNSEIIH